MTIHARQENGGSALQSGDGCFQHPRCSRPLEGRKRANPAATRSAEAGFARDMTTHHAQAVEMGLIAFDQGTDGEVRQIGGDIATGQQGEIGMMQTWLRAWGLDPTGSEPRMAWMPGGTEMVKNGLMPGMATPEQMEHFYQHLQQVMTEVDFRDRTQSGTHLMGRIRRMYNRAEIDANEVNILRGFLTAVQNRRRRAGESGGGDGH